jgi:hypothetical protein
MRRTLVAAAVVIAGLAPFMARLSACGDKSLTAGNIRMQRALLEKHPASILIYGQPYSRIAAATKELKLQQTLRLAGHSYREVTTPSELDAALASGAFNVIIADLAEAPDVLKHIDPARPRPAVIAVAYKLSKAEVASAAKAQRFLLKVPSRTAQFLDTITEAVRSSDVSPHKL